MPRKARIDAADALHHFIVRGISAGGLNAGEITITPSVSSKICSMATMTAATAVAILDESFIPKIPELFLNYTLVRVGRGPAPYGCNPDIPGGPHIVRLEYSPTV